jgi:ssDNA-binding Zn-finger/Zn-ribbon topoisomerase 1
MKQLANGKELGISCPNCGHDTLLIVRTTQRTGAQFLGCPNWPDCTHTQEIPIDAQLRANGQKGLFDQ